MLCAVRLWSAEVIKPLDLFPSISMEEVGISSILISPSEQIWYFSNFFSLHTALVGVSLRPEWTVLAIQIWRPSRGVNLINCDGWSEVGRLFQQVLLPALGTTRPAHTRMRLWDRHLNSRLKCWAMPYVHISIYGRWKWHGCTFCSASLIFGWMVLSVVHRHVWTTGYQSADHAVCVFITILHVSSAWAIYEHVWDTSLTCITCFASLIRVYS